MVVVPLKKIDNILVDRDIPL